MWSRTATSSTSSSTYRASGMIYFEDLEVGAETTFGTYDVTREEVIEFAQKYDPQPFHLDEAAGQDPLRADCGKRLHTAAMTRP